MNRREESWKKYFQQFQAWDFELENWKSWKATNFNMEEQALPDILVPHLRLKLFEICSKEVHSLEPIPKPGPDQCKCQVFYTVSGENGYCQQFMMLCPKTMDKNESASTCD